MARLFVAIELPDDARAECARVADELRPGLAGASFPPPENLHCTVAFLGDVDEPAAIASRLQVVRSVGAIPSGLVSLGAFPSSKRARVVWVGLEGDLGPLARAVWDALATVGFEPESRPFRAHVTVARMRAPARVSLDIPVRPTPFVVASVSLMRSTLRGSKHPVYERVAMVDLGV